MVKKTRKSREHTKVRVQQLKTGQFIITLPTKVAKEWLDVKKGDRIEFSPYKGKVCIHNLSFS